MENPSTEALLECLQKAENCLTKYVNEYMDYALMTQLDFDPGVDISRCIVSLEILIKRLKNQPVHTLFRAETLH